MIATTLKRFILLFFIAALVVPGAGIARSADHSAAQLQQVVNQAYDRYKGLKDGKNADYIPILATVPSDLFGIVIVTRDGKIYSKGDVDY